MHIFLCIEYVICCYDCLMPEESQAAQWEKFSTYLKKGQRQELRIKAIQEGKEVREVVAALLELWLTGKVSLDE